MNFTLFLNSRGRARQLDRFVTICESATDNHEIEMIITGDIDDQETVDFLGGLTSRKTFIFHPIIGERPQSLCASFNNMARLALGKYLFVLNDDAEIMTKGWDTIALNRIKEFQFTNGYKDDIIYGSTSDNSIDKVTGKKYASFPIISKEAVDTLGFFMHEQFVGLGGDSSIYRVYDEVKRVVDLSDIHLDHIYHNHIFKVLSPDKTAHEMRLNSYSNPVDPFTYDVSADIRILQSYIDEKNQ